MKHFILAAALAITPSFAAIVITPGTSGVDQGQVLVSTDLTENGVTSDLIQVWTEHTDLTLGQDVTLRLPGTGVSLDLAGLDSAALNMVMAGTRVGSYLIHYNPQGDSPLEPEEIRSVTVQFDYDILGISYDGPDGSELGLSSGDSIFGIGLYSPFAARGLDFAVGVNQRDLITFVDARTIRVDLFRVNGIQDQIRVITQAPRLPDPSIPEPGTYVLAGSALAALVAIRRRK